MAARTRKIQHDDETRAKIKAAQIINRLYGHVMGTVDLNAAQVSSAKVLLGKVLPDLQAVSLNADVKVSEISAVPLTPEQWAAQHASDE